MTRPPLWGLPFKSPPATTPPHSLLLLEQVLKRNSGWDSNQQLGVQISIPVPARGTQFGIPGSVPRCAVHQDETAHV